MGTSTWASTACYRDSFTFLWVLRKWLFPVWRCSPTFIWRCWENLRKTPVRIADLPREKVEVLSHRIHWRYFLCVCVCIWEGSYFMILSVAGLWTDRWMMNWKWFGKSQSWPNLGTIPEFASGNKEYHEKSRGNPCPIRDSLFCWSKEFLLHGSKAESSLSQTEATNKHRK
jgi:hypothetical protein